MILHKINNAPDSLCKKCAQLYKGECKAFSLAHTQEEYESRTKGDALCMPPSMNLECTPGDINLVM